jgi:DNA-binding transcriptional LysR family regulator
MELRQLDHFVAVAEERHFSRAARRLHIVQSGLSASIRSLERELGADLFVRSTRRVELSEAGRAFLPEARRVLASAAAARDAVAGVEGLLRGTLAIGIMQILGFLELPALLGRFHREHPGVEIHLRQDAAPTLVEDVREGRLDLAFVALPARELRGVGASTLAAEPMVLACAATHRLSAREAVTLAALRDETFVECQPDWGVRIAVDRAFAAAGIARRIAFEVNDVPTLLALVAHGLGVSVVPRWVRTAELPLTLVPLRGRAPRWDLSVVTRKHGPATAAARVLLAMALDRGDQGGPEVDLSRRSPPRR